MDISKNLLCEVVRDNFSPARGQYITACKSVIASITKK